MSAARKILQIIKDGAPIRSQALEGDGEVMLGRAEGCVIRLEDRAISREHAVFRAVEGGVHVEKRSEFAPLSVNGIECTQALVKEADVIAIGPYLVRVTNEGGAPAARDVAPATESLALDAGPDTAPLGELAPAAPEPSLAPTAELSPEPDASAPELGTFDAAPAGDAPAEPAAGMELAGPDSPGEAPAEGGGLGMSLEMPGDAPAADAPGGLSLEPPPEEPVEEAADDAATKLTPAAKLSVKLIIPSGAANVTEFEITKDEISLGRGQNCDIVLDDKKASRKNAIIRRAGLSFTIKDLESANGTYVNGNKVTEQELFSEDIIRIGGAEMRFVAKSADYERREADFMPVPAFTDEASLEIPQMDGLMLPPASTAETPPDSPLALSGGGGVQGVIPVGLGPAGGIAQGPGLNGIPGGIPGITGIAPPDVKHMSFFDKVRNFKDLPPRQKIIYAFIIAGLLYLFLDFMFPSEPEPPPPPKKKAAAPKVDAGPMTFERLPPDKQRFVEAQHALAFDHYKNKEYDKALYELGKIFALINDYKDSREIERYAKEGKRKLEAFEEEKRKKEEEARLKQKIQALVDEAKARMEHKDYEQARELFTQISILDPDNTQIVQWKKEIEDYEEQKRMKEQEEQVRKEINARAWDVFKEGLALKKQGKYHSAIEVLAKVADVGPSDKKVVARAAQEIARCRAAIKARREPLLAEARKLEEAGEYTKAFNYFKKATRADPPHPEGYAGMARIRELLHERGKVIYTEAVLAESYSDFATAKKKYTEILAVVPQDDLYYERARRKLLHFFKTGGEPIQ